jgi:NADPH:quinone reductase-like Zn-dependent oxidoreductase
MSGLIISSDRQTVTFGPDLPTASFYPPNNDPHQYLIKVDNAGITEGELLWRGVKLGETEADRLHHIPAHEVSGTVFAMQRNPNLPRGSGWNPLYAVGDSVFGFLNQERDGAAAEYVVAYESEITKFAPDLSPVEAASVPWAALTAWQGLFAYYRPTENPSAGSTLADGTVVVVTGAMSAVGRAIIQIAAWGGAQQGLIAVVDDPGTHGAFLKSLGATEILATADFDTTIKTREDAGEFWRVTLVFDTVGSPVSGRAVSMVQKSATVLSTKEFVFSPDVPIPAEPKTETVFPSSKSSHLDWIVTLVHIEALKPFVSEVVPLVNGRRAFEDLGKVSSDDRKIVLGVTGKASVESS